MSRFTQQNLIIDKISDNDVVELTQVLIQQINCNNKIINKRIKDFEYSENEYRIYEINEDVVLVCNRIDNNKKNMIHIGYPFPVKSIEICRLNNFNLYDSNKCNFGIYLRGKILRSKQKNLIMESLCNIYGINGVENIADSLMHNKLNKILDKSKRVLYIDCNDYIGDSIISLSIIDQLKGYFSLDKVVVASKNYQHINLFYNSIPYNSDEIEKYSEEVDFIIWSNYTDNHIAKLIQNINVMYLNKPIYILGRRILLDTANKTIKMYYVDKNDVLLVNQGIFNYYEDMFKDAFNKVFNSDYKRKNIHENIHMDLDKNNMSIFINPFTSVETKDIQLEFTVSLIKELLNSTNFKIIVSNGAKQIKEIKYINEVKKILNEDLTHDSLKRRILFLDDYNLTDLYNKLIDRNIVMGITADTSISHMFTLIGITNITLYKNGFWDNESILSLSTESPLSYCDTNSIQIPVIISPKVVKKSEIDCIIVLVKLFLNRNSMINILYKEEIYNFIKKIENLDSIEECENLQKEYTKIMNKTSNKLIKEIFRAFDPNLFSGFIMKESIHDKTILAKKLFSLLTIKKIEFYVKETSKELFNS